MTPTPFSPDFFEAAYHQTPGWEIGRPQPDLLSLMQEFPPISPILEVGTGTGATAIALAGAGNTVLGLDIAPTAIARAQAAIPSGLSARLSFRVEDGLRPGDLVEAPFGSIVDSGFLHLFESEQRTQFVQQLARALVPGGRYYVLGFAIPGNYPNAPLPVTMEEIHALFADDQGWIVRCARPAGFVTSVLPEPVPAVAACVERRSAAT